MIKQNKIKNKKLNLYVEFDESRILEIVDKRQEIQLKCTLGRYLSLAN